MGADKRRIELRGRTLLHRAVGTLRLLSTDIIITVHDDSAVDGDLRTVRDEVPGRGPLGGILTGLRHIRHSHALVVPVDMPLLTVRFLSHLSQASLGWDVTVPRWTAGIEPLVGVYAARCVGPLERFLAGPSAAARDFVRSMEPAVRYVEEGEIRRIGDPAALFFNINTPGDVQEVTRLLRRSAPSAAPSWFGPEGPPDERA